MFKLYGFTMIGGNIGFQTFYTSKEQSNSPLITEIIKLGKILDKNDPGKEIRSLTMSLRYGKRLIINSDYDDIGGIKREEILEIIDYDPVKKNLLVIGPCQPKIESSIHWMIHHARDEVNVVVQLNGEKIINKFQGKIPETENDYLLTSFEMIKDVLKKLKDNTGVLIKNHGVIFVYNNYKDIDKQILNILKNGDIK